MNIPSLLLLYKYNETKQDKSILSSLFKGETFHITIGKVKVKENVTSNFSLLNMNQENELLFSF